MALIFKYRYRSGASEIARLPTASAAVVINIHLRLFILLPLYGVVTLVWSSIAELVRNQPRPAFA